MQTLSLDQTPTVSDYLKALQFEESSHETQMIRAGKVQLTPGGLLQIGDDPHEVLDEARNDLAKMARIPVSYFAAIDSKLRATNFNSRLPLFLGQEEAVEVVISNGNRVHRVQRPRFGQVPVCQVVEALLDFDQAVTVSNDIRVVEYERTERLDVALVARALQAQPRPGDVVCGGVHLTIEENGAVQVGPESFRLVCRNGAMARVCAGGKHRLRRGQGKDSERKFLASIREFARTAWRDWEFVKRGLEEIARKPLNRGDIAPVIRGLRQSPFFISARAASRVEEQLRGNADDLTFYDLHNAITYVGSHAGTVLPQYRYRLRLGAGHLARGRVGVCNQCRQLMIGGEAIRN